VLKVTDTGIGIPRDRLNALFEPFTQLGDSASRRRGGTGLGLAICRRLATAMDGTIEVDSEPGRGSTFQLRLPLPAAPADRSETHVAAEADDPVPTPHEILVVDDDDNNRFVLSGLLDMMGHRVTEATDGMQALALLAERQIDVVLTDLQMPDMDGMELVRSIRALPDSRATVPIVAITADVSAGIVERCIQAGMDGYVSKPVLSDDLKRTIAAVCAGSPFAHVASRIPGRNFLASLQQDLGAETASKLVEQALTAVERSAAEIETSLRRGDTETARRAAHRLAGSAGLAGLTALSIAAAALEQQLAGTTTEDIQEDARATLALAGQSAADLRRIYSELAQNL
jgi:two-component system, sensor histidine kinase LadS